MQTKCSCLDCFNCFDSSIFLSIFVIFDRLLDQYMNKVNDSLALQLVAVQVQVPADVYSSTVMPRRQNSNWIDQSINQ